MSLLVLLVIRFSLKNLEIEAIEAVQLIIQLFSEIQCT